MNDPCLACAFTLSRFLVCFFSTQAKVQAELSTTHGLMLMVHDAVAASPTAADVRQNELLPLLVPKLKRIFKRLNMLITELTTEVLVSLVIQEMEHVNATLVWYQAALDGTAVSAPVRPPATLTLHAAAPAGPAAAAEADILGLVQARSAQEAQLPAPGPSLDDELALAFAPGATVPLEVAAPGSVSGSAAAAASATAAVSSSVVLPPVLQMAGAPVPAPVAAGASADESPFQFHHPGAAPADANEPNPFLA